MKSSSPKVFHLCSEESIGIYIRDLSIAFKDEIDKESDDYINNVDEEKYTEFLVGKYSINTPQLDFDNVEASTGKKIIPAEEFPYGFNVWKGREYEKQTVIIHIPYKGDIDLLRYNTGIHYSHTPEVIIESGNLCFEVIDFYNDLQRVNNNRQIIADNIKTLYLDVVKEIDRYNYYLEEKIKTHIKERKTKIDNIVKILGIPIKKRQNLPQSYEIPTAQTKRNISLKPQITDNNGTVEYTLEESIYLDILHVIHDYGKGFEQYPSMSKDKEEEEIRDHFLFVLQPRYNWSAVGEAFNKIGKTDILIRYNNAIAFIAECKFWHGQKLYLDTISQLFDRYLTWRNSKAAVILFVKNKDFSSVLNEVKNSTPNHSNFVRFVDSTDETWLNYVFHINDNPSREVKLAILLFPIPPNEKSISKKTKKK